LAAGLRPDKLEYFTMLRRPTRWFKGDEHGGERMARKGKERWEGERGREVENEQHCEICLYSFEKCIITVHAILHYRTITISTFSKQDSKVASYTNSCLNYT